MDGFVPQSGHLDDAGMCAMGFGPACLNMEHFGGQLGCCGMVSQDVEGSGKRNDELRVQTIFPNMMPIWGMNMPLMMGNLGMMPGMHVQALQGMHMQMQVPMGMHAFHMMQARQHNASNDTEVQRVYMGKVMNFDAERKSGFIMCDEVRKAHGQDVYFYDRVIDPSGAGVGDDVCFVLHISPKGHPYAELPMIRLATSGGFALSGCFKTGPSQECDWIECTELSLLFSQDARLSKGTHHRPGQRLAFNCFLADGVPHVREVEGVNEFWVPTPADRSTTQSMPGYADPILAPKPVRSAGSTTPKTSGPRPPPATDSLRSQMTLAEKLAQKDDTIYHGAIHQIAPEGNFGFIRCAESFAKYGRDVFVDARTIGQSNITMGKTMRFRITLNWEAKPRAEFVQFEDTRAREQDPVDDLWARYGLNRPAMAEPPTKRGRAE